MPDQLKYYILKRMEEKKHPCRQIMLNNTHKRLLLDWRKQLRKKKKNKGMNLKHLILSRLQSKSLKNAML
jgi:hypothetical protein